MAQVGECQQEEEMVESLHHLKPQICLLFFDSVDVQRQKFSAKGLDDRRVLVTLVGAHTITPAFLTRLQTLCPNNGDGSKRAALDIDSQQKFDVSFFKNMSDGSAILESDQRLWSDSETQRIVKNYAGSVRGLLGIRFEIEFPKAMIKMSSIDVKTGSQGEIRKICSNFNYLNIIPLN